MNYSFKQITVYMFTTDHSEQNTQLSSIINQLSTPRLKDTAYKLSKRKLHNTDCITNRDAYFIMKICHHRNAVPRKHAILCILINRNLFLRINWKSFNFCGVFFKINVCIFWPIYLWVTWIISCLYIELQYLLFTPFFSLK